MYYEIAGSNVRLLGSLHQWPRVAGAESLPAWVEDAYAWCEQLYFEHDLPKFQAHTGLHSRATLEHTLPHHLWVELQKAMPRSDLSTLPPWFVLSRLPLLGQDLLPGVELQLPARAYVDGKFAHFLETTEEFADRFKHVSHADYAEVFRYALDNLRSLHESVGKLYEAWLTKRVKEVEAVLPETLYALPLVERLMLDERNHAWLPKIVAVARKAGVRTLIVVGAAHLPRQPGLLAMLGREGFDIPLAPEV